MPDVNDEVPAGAAATPTAMALLGLLALASGDALSGYELRQWALHSVGLWYTTPAQSQIYRELRALAEAGHVEADEVHQDRRPDKTVYRITPAGRAAVAAWVRARGARPTALKHHAMLRLFLADEVEPSRLRPMLEAHRAGLLAALDDLENHAVALGDEPERLAGVVVDWAAELYRGDLRGTELALKALEGRDDPNDAR
ncbi:MAG: PadR family transcriptional regulator [Actinomycetota bacterium]